MVKKCRFVAMKKLLVLFAALAVLTSCDDNFKVGADYKEITVIYGLLDDGLPTDDHYIKVTKGFFSETEDNLLLARVADSIYFKDISVKVEEFFNGSLTNTFNAMLVDLTTLPDPIIKRNGVFVDSPNYAYHFNADLDPDRTYKLTVTNNQSGKVMTGETTIIDTDPNIFKVIRPFAVTSVLDFADPARKYNFKWRGPKSAAMYDILLRFYYNEENLTTNITTKKSVDLPLARFINASATNMSTDVDNSVFYSLLTANIGAGGSNIVRQVDTPELFIVAGDTEIKQYVDVNNAQGGLTNDQIRPVFTNLTGDDVLGLFSSRGTNRFGFINFSSETYDSIIGGNLTRNLNFNGRSSD